jgi:fatty acid CoA ligase FadD9
MHDRFAHWTPNGWDLFAELARRALVVSRDGGAPERAGDETTGGVRVLIERTERSLELVLHLDADRAAIALRPDASTGHRFRDNWTLALTRDDDRWHLVADAPAVSIDEARRAPLRARLCVWQRELTPSLDGERLSIELDDVAFHRHTLQSSRGMPSEPANGIAPWMTPTRDETSPWWEIDLGASMFVAWVRFDLGGVPPGANASIAAFSYPTPAGDPPRDTFRYDAQIEGSDAVTLAVVVNVVARFVRVTLTASAATSLTIASAEVLAASFFAPSLRDTMRRAFALHAERPLFAARSGDDGPYAPTRSYAAVWSRAMALARGLARRIEVDACRRVDGRIFIALMTRNRPEWVVTELAALERGYVVIPLSPDEHDAHLSAILARVSPACAVCEHRDAERLAALARSMPLLVVCDAPTSTPHVRFEDLVLEGERAAVPPPAPREPGDLYSVLYTSGSTGTPKGAMRSYATVLAMISTYGLDQNARHLSFQPFSHLSERMYLPALLVQGALTAFSRGGAWLMRELRDFEPTNLATVPRLFESVMASYRRQLTRARAASPDRAEAELEAEARAGARAAFGGRLRSIGVGSAPVSAELLAFLRHVFTDVWVAEGYGITEVGTIAVDGRILPSVEVRLAPHDSAPQSPDTPERGEILVRTPHRIDGYLGDEAATRAALDGDGFFATGDLGERCADGTVRVIGRLRNTVKLAHGEFVSIERIESSLATAPFVDQVYVHAAPGAERVAAVVVASADAPDDLAAALRAHARRAGLSSWELPSVVCLERDPFTAASGLLTTNGKLARDALAVRYAARLDALAAAPAPDTDEVAPGDDSLASRVAQVLALALRRRVGVHDAVGPTAGLDSLAAAEAVGALGAALGREVPLSWWFESDTVTALAARIGRFASASTEHTALAREDLRAGCRVPEGLATTQHPWRTVLLTGATGFLGAHLVEALLSQTDLVVLCLVRAASDDEAASRLRATLSRYEIPTAVDGRAHAIAGDLAAPRFGLTEAGYARLVDEVDAIVHAGAQVHWLASYATLRGPNVRGTRALLELATTGRLRPFHLISTISTAPSDGDERARLPVEVALAGNAYAASKWVAEAIAQRFADAGLPVAIYRPGMIAGHAARGHGNAEDYLHRYADGATELGLYLDLDACLDMTPVDFVASAIVALLRARPSGGDTWHLVNADQSMSYAAHGRAMARAGVAVAPANYEAFRTALMKSPASRLTALSSFFPARGFSMGAGPWPCARTVEALAALGVQRPVVDEALIARYVRRAARAERGLAREPPTEGPTL